MPPRRILVSTNSFFMREIFNKIFSSGDKLKFVKGKDEALKNLADHKFDVLIIDSEKEKDEHLVDYIKEVIKVYPTPIIILSRATPQKADLVFKCLESGAFTFIERPFQSGYFDLNAFRENVFKNIEGALRVNPEKFIPLDLPEKQKEIVEDQVQIFPKKAVVIGSSTGGIRPVNFLISSLPKNFPAAIFLVQHLPSSFVSSFSKRLNENSYLEVKKAEEGDLVLPGLVFVIPGGMEFGLKKKKKNEGLAEIYISLTKKDNLEDQIPSIDEVMRAVSKVFKSQTVGIILSGMGKDGLDGIREIKDLKGKSIVQDEKSAILFGMPKEIINVDLADYVLPIEKIKERLIATL